MKQKPKGKSLDYLVECGKILDEASVPQKARWLPGALEAKEALEILEGDIREIDAIIFEASLPEIRKLRKEFEALHDQVIALGIELNLGGEAGK